MFLDEEGFGTVSLEDIVLALEKAFDEVQAITGELDRTGVYSSLARPGGLVLATVKVRDPKHEKAPKYHEHAGEKAFRLGLNPGHLTSDESADESQGKYGGGFRLSVRDCILTVSGLRLAHHDAAVGMRAMTQVGLMNRTFADRLARLTGNTFWFEFMEKVAA